MKELTLSPDEIVFKIDDIDERLYFVYKGEIEIYLEKYSKERFKKKNSNKNKSK
jgi:hypothetical protein